MTARQIKSAYLTGRISFRAAHTVLRANGYSDSEADDILDGCVLTPNERRELRGENPPPSAGGSRPS
jgi:hypothetical protein